MRHSPGLLPRRATAGCCALVTLRAPGVPATAAPPASEAEHLAFAERYRAPLHGGIVRAANVSISCRRPAHRLAVAPGMRAAPSCPAARQDGPAKGRSAAGARGGRTLMVAYEKASEPSRRLAGRDGFDAVGPGQERVVRPNGPAMPPGAGGRLGPGRVAKVPSFARRAGLAASGACSRYVGRGPSYWTYSGSRPVRRECVPGVARRTGLSQHALLAYDGDRGSTGDTLSVSADGAKPVAPGDTANPLDDVLNSSISDPGDAPVARVPAYANTLGYHFNVLDLGNEIRRGGDQLTVQLVSQRDAAWVGALFAAVDAQQ